ncbi:MAG: hypothetical protein QM820_04175 [Minicystis sp.]
MPRSFAALAILAAAACSSPPPPPAPVSPTPVLPGREPVSPPGTEGLRAAPCSRRLDLSPSTAAQRAFNPGASTIEARTTLSYRLRGPAPPPVWSSSRPEALRFEDAPAGAITLIAREPGTTLVRVTAGEPGQPDAEEASVLVSVPMFVAVTADEDFADMIDHELGLAGRERALLTEAKRVVDSIYARVNLRVAFAAGLDERLPTTLPPGTFIEATLHGDLRRCVTPRSSLLNTEFGGYGEGDGARRLDRSPVHLCPAIFARHPDTMAAMVKRRARLLADPAGAALYTTIVGRALGELLAHEIGHQLLGCDNRGERRSWRCHDRLPSSLMNKAGERSFLDRTGILIKPTQYASYWRDDFPAPGTYEDRGVEAINRLPPDGRAVLDRILPVPPALPEVSCP